MKKLILLSFAVLAMASCKSKSATETKLDRKSEIALKGDWTITSVTYPGSDYIKVTSFQLADSQCFVGSTWNFISVSNKGQMNISKADCLSFSSPIKWFVNKDGQFVLKVLNAGEKARKVRDGYVLKMASQTETSFQLIDQIMVGNKSTDVVYQFQKVN